MMICECVIIIPVIILVEVVLCFQLEGMYSGSFLKASFFFEDGIKLSVLVIGDITERAEKREPYN